MKNDRRVWALLIGLPVAVFASLAVLNYFFEQPGCVLMESGWVAGTANDRAANDIWIEYGPASGEVVGIYRDLDGDGLVDERLMLTGPHAVMYQSSNRDGLLDIVRDVRNAAGANTQLSAAAPEAGPFTRAKLDELAMLQPKP